MKEGSIWAWSDDGSLKPDSPYMQYLEHLDKAGRISGRELNVYNRLKQWMIDAGFEDVEETVYLAPLAPWAKDKKLKELGKYYAAMAQDAVEAYGLRLYTQVLGWDTEKAQVHHALVKRQLRDRSVHAYTKLYVSILLTGSGRALTNGFQACRSWEKACLRHRWVISLEYLRQGFHMIVVALG